MPAPRNFAYLGLGLVLAPLGALWGCEADLPTYVAKQGFRHGSLLLKAESVEKVLARPGLEPRTEHFLRLAQAVLKFAAKNGMRTGGSYTKFIDLKRDWVTQIVMAAQPDSLTPYLFHYPIVGDLPYRGFYDEADAEALEKKFQEQGLDTYRRKVEAFSTTGWLPDPLLSTMFSDEGRLVELLLHELTHATFYFPNAADFNEAFASWMGYRLALEFIAQTDSTLVSNRERVLKELQDNHAFQLRFAKLVREILARGREFYAQPNARAKRAEYFAWIQRRLDNEPRLGKFNERWNNALILSLGTYYENVEPIESYAQKRGLSPAQFLQIVATTGPGIMPEILRASP
ncbi:MAG: aminopeptidase [Bdellovibrionales bacterium]|nr:aminopeptidase [Bdellovibrionales bacterium]